MWPRHARANGAELVEECEAFLGGRYAELLESRGRRVPVWAWINVLAFGTPHALRQVANDDVGGDAWRQARAFLASEVLGLVEHGSVSLAEVQRDIFIPLELDIVSCRTTSEWNPGEFAAAVLAVFPRRPRGGAIQQGS